MSSRGVGCGILRSLSSSKLPLYCFSNVSGRRSSFRSDSLMCKSMTIIHHYHFLLLIRKRPTNLSGTVLFAWKLFILTMRNSYSKLLVDCCAMSEQGEAIAWHLVSIYFIRSAWKSGLLSRISVLTVEGHFRHFDGSDVPQSSIPYRYKTLPQYYYTPRISLVFLDLSILLCFCSRLHGSTFPLHYVL